MDASSVGVNVSVPAHTHIYQYAYNNYQHWQQCVVCGAPSGSKTNHSLHDNGGSKTQCGDGWNTAYREVCSCGYQSAPLYMIHGFTYNYANYKGTNYGAGCGSFNNVKQITQSQFNSWYSGVKIDGKQVQWWDYDGDGYGIVLCYGPIIGNGSIIGTIEHYIGSEGDCGKKSRFEEYYALLKYIQSDDTPTRSEFVTWIRTQINTKCGSNNTYKQRHMLYGYDTKYSGVSDVNFNKIVADFGGSSRECYIGAGTWGWNSMRIHHNGDHGNGSQLYGEGGGSCYDCKTDKYRDFGNGISNTCDLCGLTVSGNESYEATYYLGCGECSNFASSFWQKSVGETLTCSGHTITGKNNTQLGTAYCIVKKTGAHQMTKQLRVNTTGTATVNDSAMGTFSKSGNNYTSTTAVVVPRSPYNTFGSYWGYASGSFTITANGVTRTVGINFSYPFADDTAPSAYGYTNATTNNGNWAIAYNSNRTLVTLTVTCLDLDQYERNQPYYRVYDSDQTTLLKTATGTTDFPMWRISGTAGTAEGNGIWRGSSTVTAEVKSSKNIYIQFYDSCGHYSGKTARVISAVDAKGPTITVSATPSNLTAWSTYQTFTVTAKDDCSWSQLGLSNSDLKTVASSAGASGSRTWTIKGNLTGTKTITFYAKDATGNVSYVTKTFGNIDNTAPKFTSQSVANVFSDIAGKSVATSWRIDCSHNDYFIKPFFVSRIE